MKNFILLFLLSNLFILLSCQEPSDVIYDDNAAIIWTGESNIDGCGFFVELDSVKYKPESESVISPYFKKSPRTNVIVQYIDLHYDKEYYCADSSKSKSIGVIKIISIALKK